MRYVWHLRCNLFLFFLSCCYGKDTAFFQDAKFNEGEYGKYPMQEYKTTRLRPPRPNIMRNFSDCDDGSFIFVAPRGHAVRPTFFILDHNLELVWGPDERFGKVYNFQVQYYKGEPYLFYWGGDDSVGGHGEGKYYMLNQHYEEYKEISSGKELRGDLHSFSITEDNTAVYTVYEQKQVDLTSVGKGTNDWIWDGLFQERDVDTGRILFEWRASHHVNFTDVYVSPNAATKNKPWDWFHINMVEKDKAGNYLVSTRYGRCALYISKHTGEVLWQLGGKKNSFKDLSGGDATTFLGQHDIHWDGEKAITMFDNRADWYNKLNNESIGHRINVDVTKMTAQLAQSFYHPNHILSTSPGSMQTLPNGNVLIGYGYNGVFTEYDSKGHCLCDVTFMPQSLFGTGDVQNYRALKFNWTGIPLSVPALVHEDNTLYMSWLGATKVRSWSIEDSDQADEGFEEVQLTQKDGFETEVVLKDALPMRKYVRVVAVDGDGKHLSTSRAVDLHDRIGIWGETAPNVNRPSSMHDAPPVPDTDFDGEAGDETIHPPKVDAELPAEVEAPDLKDEYDPWTYNQEHPELAGEKEEPVTQPEKAPEKEPQTSPQKPTDASTADQTQAPLDDSYASEVAMDQVLLVLGLILGIGASIRLACWHSTLPLRLWMRRRQGSRSKINYPYSELPSSVRHVRGM